MKVWIAYAGEYEDRGVMAVFDSKEGAEFYRGGDCDIEEWDVCTGIPIKMTHYECSGWLDDVETTILKPTSIVEGFRIHEREYESWNIHVPKSTEVTTDSWQIVVFQDPSGSQGPMRYAKAKGRDKARTRRACIDTLKGLKEKLQ